MWIKQRGSTLGYKIILMTYRVIGYKAAKLIIWFVSIFYAIVTKNERESIKDYYKKIKKPYSFFKYILHINQFALSIFDRFVSRITPDVFEIQIINEEHFLKQNGGKLIVLSHVGNWANTFTAFKLENYTVNIVGSEQLKDSIQKYENSLKYKNSSRVKSINLDEGFISSVKIAQALQKGEYVAMMADRFMNKNKFIKINFFNSIAKFNKSPFEIAYNRGVEIIGVSVIRINDKKYKLFFSNPIRGDKSISKEDAIKKMATSYVKYLENILDQYPKQWYNFYKFWEE